MSGEDRQRRRLTDFLKAEAADKGCFVVVGGGDSVSAANKAGVTARMSHVSTGGGASMELMAGKKLPGVESLLDAYGLGMVH